LNNNELLGGYELKNKIFSGLNTDLSLSRILKNGNMVKITYYWDFMTTGNISFNKLDSANHLFLLSLVFRID
jgi:hypothetical protein